MSNNSDTYAPFGTTDPENTGDVGPTGLGGSRTGSNYTPGPTESGAESGTARGVGANEITETISNQRGQSEQGVEPEPSKAADKP